MTWNPRRLMGWGRDPADDPDIDEADLEEEAWRAARERAERLGLTGRSLPRPLWPEPQVSAAGLMGRGGVDYMAVMPDMGGVPVADARRRIASARAGSAPAPTAAGSAAVMEPDSSWSAPLVDVGPAYNAVLTAMRPGQRGAPGPAAGGGPSGSGAMMDFGPVAQAGTEREPTVDQLYKEGRLSRADYFAWKFGRAGRYAGGEGSAAQGNAGVQQALALWRDQQARKAGGAHAAAGLALRREENQMLGQVAGGAGAGPGSGFFMQRDPETGVLVQAKIEPGKPEQGWQAGQVVLLGGGRKAIWTGKDLVDADSGEPLYEKETGTRFDSTAYMFMSPEQQKAYLDRMAAGTPGKAPAASSGAVAVGVIRRSKATGKQEKWDGKAWVPVA